MILNNQKPIVFKNTCGAIFDEKLLKKAILWYSKKYVCRIKKIYMFMSYPGVTIGKEKMHIHRLIWKYSNRVVNLSRDSIVHHKNHNKLDSSINNLELITSRLHGSLHNKNKTISEEHKRKLTLHNKKRKIHPKRLKLEGLEEFINKNISYNKISKHYGCSVSTIRLRILKIKPNYIRS